ncbi:MAG: transcriptional repressor LexA [Chloroflexi bacterium]|nr:transcriptional repressor LexA [Chloroflexota bacterium]
MKAPALKLSPKQKKMAEFIRSFLDGKGYPPTVRDIQRGCDISSTSVVDYNLNILERLGLLRRDPDVSRGIELLDGHHRTAARVPLIGAIAAGAPIPVPSADTWRQEVTDTVEVSPDLVKGKDGVFALRVKGKSMVDAFIDDGDVVLLQQARTAENGQMVAAWLKSRREATLKRFYREKGRIRLQPANDALDPIYADPTDVEVQGRVIGVVRRVA